MKKLSMASAGFKLSPTARLKYNSGKREPRELKSLLVGAVTITAIFGCLPKSVQAASLGSFDQIYTFGDSASDNGNTFKATAGLLPPSPPYYEGRYSNGPVWVEDLASKLDVPLTDLAFAGATTGQSNVLNQQFSLNLPGVQQQIDSFTAAHPSANSKALYIVWAGFNDYLGGGATSNTETVENLSTAVKSLNEAGAKNIMVPNLPDLGKYPVTTNTPNAPLLSTLSKKHNSDLAQALANLSQAPGSDINIISFDVNSLFSAAIDQPENFGFTNVTDACFNTTTLNVCSNPDQYLSWDGLHVTARAQEVLAESAFSALSSNSPSKSVPEPTSTLGVLAFGAAALMVQKLGSLLSR
ncbi:Phospholipase/lecithinase/hemolysin [uncultured Synechococcales cyanobacterium]|uniref:Phospholipase/lecithinase/hemolysin n=1 Tax=uncultured Synechococcales cyanobacterium TaxID=1936017 RepID=A0A6J4VPT5_9CYAN|nr:Phospholipase/lecithinase/hemolysin [uncultured Synechococcales cyanobacterium]